MLLNSEAKLCLIAGHGQSCQPSERRTCMQGLRVLFAARGGTPVLKCALYSAQRLELRGADTPASFIWILTVKLHGI